MLFVSVMKCLLITLINFPKGTNKTYVFYFFFHIRHPFLSQCLLRMRKRRKSNLIQKMFYDGWKFRRQCVNVIDTTRGRIYFLTFKKFGQKIWTVCNDLNPDQTHLNQLMKIFKRTSRSNLFDQGWNWTVQVSRSPETEQNAKYNGWMAGWN